jgi:hypothetical protein
MNQANTNNARQQSSGSLGLQALAHGSVFLLLIVTLWVLETWLVPGQEGIIRYLAATWAFLSGMALSHLIHEWGHFAGALISGAKLTIKPAAHPLFFDFDYDHNKPRQFLLMSMGGLLGNFLLLVTLLLLVTPASLITTSLLAAVIGQLVYVLILELPVSCGVMAGGAPLAVLTTHFSQGGPLFIRATLGALVAAAAVFVLC